MENTKGQIFKTFYFLVIRTMKLGDSTHVDYFLVSEQGFPENIHDIQTRANDKTKKIVAQLSKRDNVAYHFAGVEQLSQAKYNVLKGYFDHYVDESLRVIF